MKFTTTAAAAGVALMMAGGASAATIKLAENESSAATITIVCPSGCSGYVGSPATLSSTNADAYSIGSADESNLASNFNSLTGSTVTASDVDKTDGGSEDFAFNVDNGVFFAKYGTWTSFLFSDAVQTVTFKKTGGGPAGLSNYGTIGDTNPVPLPAAGWLMLAGLGGLAVMRRRKKAA